MSIDYHRHCQATVLSANGTGNGNGATWSIIKNLDLPNLDENWLDYFSGNKKNITQDLAGILHLIDDVSGNIAYKGRDIRLSIGDQTLSFNTLIQKPDEVLSMDLPIATTTRLGTIKIGNGFTIKPDGTLSVLQGIIDGVRGLSEGSNISINNLGNGIYEINSSGGGGGGSGGVINGEKYNIPSSLDVRCDLTTTFTNIYTAKHDCYLVIRNKSLINKNLIFGIDGNPIQATPEYVSMEEKDDYAFGVPVKMDTTIQCKCSEGSTSLVFDFIEYKLYKSNPSEDGYVSRIKAGQNIEISPSKGTGEVTITATGGGSDIEYLTQNEYDRRKSSGELDSEKYYATPQTPDDEKYVKKSGDTMTGMLTLKSDPTSNLHSATKQYVDQVGNRVTILEGQVGQLNTAQINVYIAPDFDYYVKNGYVSHIDENGRTYYTKDGMNNRYGGSYFYPGNDNNLENQYKQYNASNQNSYPVFSLNCAMQFLRRFRANGTIVFKVFCEQGVYYYVNVQTISHPDAVGSNSILIEGVVNQDYKNESKHMPRPYDEGFSPFDLYLTQFWFEGTSSTGEDTKHPGRLVAGISTIACSQTPNNITLKYVLINADYEHITNSPGYAILTPQNSIFTLNSCAICGLSIYASGIVNPQIHITSTVFKSIGIDDYTVENVPEMLYPVCFCSSKRYINLGGRNTIYGISYFNNGIINVEGRTYIYCENLNYFINSSYGDIILNNGSVATSSNISQIRIDARLRTSDVSSFTLLQLFRSQYGTSMLQGSNEAGYRIKTIPEVFALNMYSSVPNVNYPTLSSIATPAKDGYDYTTGSTQNLFSRIIDSTTTYNGKHYVNGNLPT